MKIGAIVKAQQADIYNQLNKRNGNHNKKRGKQREHLSFSFVDRLMREKADVDERKCRGR